MVNEIKMDHIENMNKLTSAAKPQRRDAGLISHNQEDSIKIHLSSLHDLMSMEVSPAENARILEMKQRINSKNYKIDTDELASKLYHDVFKNISSIG